MTESSASIDLFYSLVQWEHSILDSQMFCFKTVEEITSKIVWISSEMMKYNVNLHRKSRLSTSQPMVAILDQVTVAVNIAGET